MEGTSCQHAGCNVCDFLPFQCDLCERSFCSAHRSRFIHDCLPTIVKPYSATESSPTGSASVKDMFRGIETRHDSAATHSTKQHFHVHSSTVQKQAADPRIAQLDASAAKNKSSKQSNIANRTKMMLMKNKAVGSPSIPSEDRFYLGMHFVATGEVRYFYFTFFTTIGEMAEHISRHYTLLAFGVPQPPTDQTLVTETADSTWTYFDRNSKLCDCFKSCETVKLSVVPIAQVMENQNILLSLQLSKPAATTGETAAEQAEQLLYTPNAEYTKNEQVVYVKSTEDPRAPIEFPAVIIAVHREDVELYYTIELVVDGEKREKQTDGYHLRKIPQQPINAAMHSKVHDQPSTSLPDLSKSGAGGGFSVRVAVGNKTTEIGGLLPDTPVVELEKKIKWWGKMEGRGRIKMICRGKTVAPTAKVLRDTNITPGCKISVMVSAAR